jgi:alkylation response protein AidB-like acyl-CoA dehydrogenase
MCRFGEKYCNEEQKMKYLVPLAKGNRCFCLSEPEAGSDATSKQQRLIKETIIC